MGERGEAYQARFDGLAAGGGSVHGEADLLDGLAASRSRPGQASPCRVLDAGCGTGRVGIELARRGMDVTGIDLDADMLGVARSRAPELRWHLGDLTTLELEAGSFDMVVMAGNVMIFLRPGSEAAAVANLARCLAPHGLLVAGFQLGTRAWSLDEYDAWAAGAGLSLKQRWSTWDRRPWHPAAGYAVSVHVATTEGRGDAT